MAYLGATPPPRPVTTDDINDGAVQTADVADNAITFAKMADSAVHANTINDGAITTAKLGTSAVETAKINDGAITAAKLGTSAVETAKIADDAVTLDKMAGGTDGNLITFDANGDPAYVATGTAAQVLTSNGAGAAPTFQDAAGGSVDVITNGTISAGTSTVNFTGFDFTTYIEYRLYLDGVYFSSETDNVIGARMSTDGGSTWLSASNYYSSTYYWDTSGGTGHHTYTGQSAWRLTEGGVGNEGLSGYLSIIGGNNEFADDIPKVEGVFTYIQSTSGTTFRRGIFWGMYNATSTDLDGFQLYSLTGTISDGAYTLVAVRRS